jgi:hypothetical protein
MNTRALLFSAVTASGLLISSVASAQSPQLQFPQPSPTSTLKQHVGLTDIEISYSRPSAKGRPVIGALVPFGQVWRTGANGRTTISFSTPVKLNDVEIPAGKYSLFTIPGEDRWTILLNKNTTGNALSYDPSNEVVRIETPAIKIGENIETFSIMINNIRDDSARIDLLWEHTAVPIRLNLDVVSSLQPKIEAALTGDNVNKQYYYPAAMFYYDHGLDLQKAKTWIEAATKANETYYNVYLKAEILAKLGDKQGAIAAARHSSELASKIPEANGYIKLNGDLITSLSK